MAALQLQCPPIPKDLPFNTLNMRKVLFNIKHGSHDVASYNPAYKGCLSVIDHGLGVLGKVMKQVNLDDLEKIKKELVNISDYYNTHADDRQYAADIPKEEKLTADIDKLKKIQNEIVKKYEDFEGKQELLKPVILKQTQEAADPLATGSGRHIDDQFKNSQMGFTQLNHEITKFVEAKKQLEGNWLANIKNINNAMKPGKRLEITTETDQRVSTRTGRAMVG